MKKLLSLLLTFIVGICCLSAFGACAPTSDFDRIKAKGTLVVGVTVYPPMDYIDEESGEWVGFDAEVAEKMAAEWGVTAQFVIIKWNNKVTELNSGNIDVIWNGMTASEDLGKEIDFSVSYAENRQVAVIKQSNQATINSVETVKASTIAVEKGSAGDIVATETLEAATVNKVEAQVNALLEVEAGTSQVAIIDYTMAASVVGKGDYADLVIVDPDAVSFEREVFAVGLKKNSDLTEKMNALFKKYYQDGTLAELAEKYESVVLNTEALGAL